MTSAQSDKKTALIAALNDRIAAMNMPMLGDFAASLFARASAEDLTTYRAEQLAEQAASGLARLQSREPGRHRISIVDPPDSDETLIEIVNDDMPFLVDSVMGELNETGCDIRMVLHPTIAVSRDLSGKLLSLAPMARALPGSGLSRESLIQINVGRIVSRTWRDALAQRLDTVLRDVRQAVMDWRAMLARVDEVVSGYRRNPPPISPDEINEAIAFLEWLRDDNFIFLGTRDYYRTAQGWSERVVDGGLGVLRNPDVRVLRRGNESLNNTPEMRDFLASPRPLIVTKSNVRSVIHRRVPMDYVGIKIIDGSGQLTGELRIVGLFTSTAYTRSTRTIPYVRHKVDQVMARAGFEPKSHSGKALTNVLENLPRDELFQIDNETLYDFSMQILALDERPRVRVLARRDLFDRFVSVMVHVPRERYTTSIRVKIGDYLEEALAGRVTFAQPTFLEGGIARINFILSRQGDRTPEIEQEALETTVSGLLRTWTDNLVSAFDALPPDETEALRDRYARAFGIAYQEAYGPEVALGDARLLQSFGDDHRIAIDFHDRSGDGGSRLGLKLYHTGGPIPLSDRVPVLEHMGLRVIDERTYRIEPASRLPVYLHDMSLDAGGAAGAPLEAATDARLEGLFLAVWGQRAEDDNFNRLVLATRLDWRQIALVRGLAHYLRQVGLTYPLTYVAEAVLRNAALTARIVALFEARHDPDRHAGGRAAAVAALEAEIAQALEAVASLDDDTILRRLVNLVTSVLRTNYYQRDEAGELRATFAFKIDSRAITDLPNPKPLREIWVYSPRVEGVHLRFARVARGGLRWSDRPQDFRTEVLGLVKAQQVKNAVIVPAGAKGGFVPKFLKPGMPRDAWLTEGTEAYKIFVSSLLTVTDNLQGEAIAPPPRVVRHDGDDPYLVVAADKGTATFSDTANGLSQAAGFWLGDAFASGGSVGYDHKKMGITARGAFEAVKRHFREMNVNVMTTPVSVVGVGDMSGDVFGNGMLLAPTIRLVAAFDHRDIFLDPNPDMAASLKERQRMFNLPRSSWADYDRSLISEGGGVYSRSAKVIDLSPEIRAVLGIEAEKATPTEVMRAILKAPVDLLWFGGIGTYVRSSEETDAEVGDRATDALRIRGQDVRAKVIGEGANLGVTQRGRIEYGLKGGRCNSDAIDNSAGVNCSDVEVNTKITLNGAISAGELPVYERDALLADMTDEVAELVLANNRSQTLAIGVEWTLGAAELPRHRRLMDRLSASGRLDRAVEFLPDDAALTRRAAAGQSLTRSEIGVLLAYAKMALKEALLASNVPDDDWFASELTAYFSKRLGETYGRAISAHRLKREIIATRLANALVDRGGTTFVSRLMDDTGADEATIARAFVVANAVFRFDLLVADVDARIDLDAGVAADAHHRIRAALVAATTWAIRNIPATGDLKGHVERFAAPVAALRAGLDAILPPALVTARQTAAAQWATGLDAATAGALAHLDDSIGLTDVCLVSEATKAAPDRAAGVFFGVASALGLDRLQAVAARTAISDRYDAQVLERANGMIDDAHRRVAIAALGRKDGLDGWLGERAEGLKKLNAMLGEIAAQPHPTVSAFTVAAGVLMDLAAQ